MSYLTRLKNPKISGTPPTAKTEFTAETPPDLGFGSKGGFGSRGLGENPQNPDLGFAGKEGFAGEGISQIFAILNNERPDHL